MGVLRIVGRESHIGYRNDHGFISKKYFFIGTRLFGEAQSKTMRAYAQSGLYHTIVKSRDSYQGGLPNLQLSL